MAAHAAPMISFFMMDSPIAKAAVPIYSRNQWRPAAKPAFITEWRDQ
jgi:hypothetical protein